MNCAYTNTSRSWIYSRFWDYSQSKCIIRMYYSASYARLILKLLKSWLRPFISWSGKVICLITASITVCVLYCFLSLVIFGTVIKCNKNPSYPAFYRKLRTEGFELVGFPSSLCKKEPPCHYWKRRQIKIHGVDAPLMKHFSILDLWTFWRDIKAFLSQRGEWISGCQRWLWTRRVVLFFWHWQAQLIEVTLSCSLCPQNQWKIHAYGITDFA